MPAPRTRTPGIGPRAPNVLDTLNILCLLGTITALAGLLIDNRNHQNKTAMKLAELAAALTAIDTKLTKAQEEIIAEIQKLRDALNDVDLPAEATAALDALSAKAQALDDVVPDAPPA